MMRYKAKDLVATLLVALIAAPYIGYLVRGEMPFIKDPRGMSVTGLVLGIAAFWVIARGDAFDTVGRAEAVLAGIGLALGVAALLLAETAVAEVLLAVFIGSIVVIWAVEMTDHAGLLHRHTPTGVAR